MRKTAGFTLVELLVVVAIIGFLSAAGMVVFADSQAKGRDAKRKADIDSIAKALEIHKDDSGYKSIAIGWFGSSSGIPKTDPKTNPYCIATDAIGNPTNAAAWTACSAVTGGGTGGANAAWTAVDENIPTSTPFDSWRVCAWLENPGGTAGVYCRYSLQ